MTNAWQKSFVRTVASLALLAAPALCGLAQQTSAPAQASLGQQAVGVVLKHYALSPLAVDEKTKKPLARDGKWSAGKTPPPACPQGSTACTEVFYEVPAEGVRCSWVVVMNPDGTDGKFLDEDDDTERYMLLRVSPADSKALVVSREKPVYPPIAMAARVEGSVVMSAIVGKSGHVQDVIVVSAPAMLRQSGIEAAQRWIFKPLTIGTRTVPYTVQLLFTFHSRGSSDGSVEVAP